MNNLSSYCGLFDAKIRASDKDLPVLYALFDNLTFYDLLGLDNNGFECPGYCPMFCGKDNMNCPGGDDGNGCMMPDTCMPTKGGEW